MHMIKERNIFMTKLWATLKDKAQQIFIKQENEELKADQGKEIDYHRYWKKRAEEAETETILIKGIGMNSPEMKAAKAKITELQSNLDRIKKENNDLYNRIADLTDPAIKAQRARESGL